MPETALTLAEMHVRGWQVRATCNRCRVQLRVSLPALIKTHGPDTIWWGQRSRCPGFECDHGELVYGVRSHQAGSWVSMQREPSRYLLEAWKAKRRPRLAGPR